MTTAATRPETFTLQDFNEILDRKINFIDSEGKTIKTSFWSALHHAPASAEKLLDQLNERVEHYREAKDKSGIAKELTQFQEKRDHFVTLVATARTVVEEFSRMQSSLGKSSSPIEAKPIMVEGDIAMTSSKITDLTNAFELNYLTGRWMEGTGHAWNSAPTIPGRIERLAELQSSEKV